MTPQEVIEAYVNDVATRLPRAKRNDVAIELRALLSDELQGKAEETGRPADEASALELVRSFGAPEDVAERYRTPSFTIVAPTGTTTFAALAFGGLALQWLGSLPPVFSQGAAPGGVLGALGAWWLTLGLGAFWWPGFMVIAAIIGSWMRHRWPPADARRTWRPRAQDTDVINRPLYALGAIGALIGVAAFFLAPRIIQTTLPAAAPAFELSALAPAVVSVVVLLWGLGGALFAIVYTEGRWRPLTRHLTLALTAVWAAFILWGIVATPMFVSEITNEATKGPLAVVLFFVLLDMAITVRRIMRRPNPNAVMAAAL